MNSEKVKEIKKALGCCSRPTCTSDCPLNGYHEKNHKMLCRDKLIKDTLILINELESENEWLVGKIKEKNNESADYLLKIQQLKDRIAELEEYIKGNANDAKAFVENWHNDLNKELTSFAEMLKGKAIRRKEFIGELLIDNIEYVNVKDIDKTLKKFLKGENNE